MNIHEKINLRSWFTFLPEKNNVPYKLKGKFWEQERKQPFNKK